MPYILNKTNGSKLLTVDDASLDNSTSLTFVGKNYAGYGEVVNENFLKLLENFSNLTPPTKPIAGQLWFDSANKKLSIYDSKKFKDIAYLQVKSSNPTEALEGDLWWDSTAKQLKAFNGTEFKTIGPLSSSARSSWEFAEEIPQDGSSSSTVPVIKGKIGLNNIAVVSRIDFIPRSLSDLTVIDNSSQSFSIVKKGITLVGSDDITGSSKDAGVFFWGTAAESLVASTATNIITSDISNDINYNVTFVSTTNTNRDSQIYVNSGITYNPSTQVLNTVVTSARYADLAERYETDSQYDVGTVVIIGGSKEITVTHSHADKSVLGVISDKPAYIMNSDAGNNNTHPCVALRGRVPCKVIGNIKKGDLLVSSATPGYAEVMQSNDHPAAIVGKSLQDFDGPKGLIEIVI